MGLALYEKRRDPNEYIALRDLPLWCHGFWKFRKSTLTRMHFQKIKFTSLRNHHHVKLESEQLDIPWLYGLEKGLRHPVKKIFPDNSSLPLVADLQAILALRVRLAGRGKAIMIASVPTGRGLKKESINDLYSNDASADFLPHKGTH